MEWHYSHELFDESSQYYVIGQLIKQVLFKPRKNLPEIQLMQSVWLEFEQERQVLSQS